MAMDQPADHGVQEDDQRRSQRRDEEEDLATRGHASRAAGTPAADEVQQRQGRQPHDSIGVGAAQMLERVDDDSVRRLPRQDAADAHQAGNLPDGDVERGAGHEGRHGR